MGGWGSEVGGQNPDSFAPRSPTSSGSQTAVEKGLAAAEQLPRTLQRALNPALLSALHLRGDALRSATARG